jgi:hypothetical protein
LRQIKFFSLNIILIAFFYWKNFIHSIDYIEHDLNYILFLLPLRINPKFYNLQKRGFGENSVGLVWVLLDFLFCFFKSSNDKYQRSRKMQRYVRLYSPFCVPEKVTKLIGLKRPPFLSPTNLIIFACTQNGEYIFCSPV